MHGVIRECFELKRVRGREIGGMVEGSSSSSSSCGSARWLALFRLLLQIHRSHRLPLLYSTWYPGTTINNSIRSKLRSSIRYELHVLACTICCSRWERGRDSFYFRPLQICLLLRLGKGVFVSEHEHRISQSKGLRSVCAFASHLAGPLHA